MELYIRIRENSTIKKITAFLNSYYFIAVACAIALIGNLFALELLSFTLITILSLFILIFAEDTHALMPLFSVCYYVMSRDNSPVYSDERLLSIPASRDYIIILGAIIIVGMILRIIIAKDYKKVNHKNMTLLYGFFALAFAYIFSGLFSPWFSFKSVFIGLLEILSLVLFYFYFSITVDWKKVPKNYLFYIAFGIAVVICIELFYLILTVQSIIVNGKLVKEAIVTGWGIQNNMAGMIVLMLPFILYLAKVSKFGWLYLLFSFVCVVAVLLTMCRTALLFVAIIMVIGLIILIIKGKTRLMNCIVIALVIICAVIALFAFNKDIEKMFSSMINVGFDDSGRGKYFTYGFDVFKKHPIFGGSFISIDDPNLIVYKSLGLPARYHNLFLQIIASCGIVGVLAFGYHCFGLGVIFFKNRSVERFFMLFGVLVLFAISMFDNHFFNIGPGLFYSLVLAFAQADYNQKKMEKQTLATIENEKVEDVATEDNTIQEEDIKSI